VENAAPGNAAVDRSGAGSTAVVPVCGDPLKRPAPGQSQPVARWFWAGDAALTAARALCPT